MMAEQKPKTKEQRRARRKVLERKPKPPDTMIAMVGDTNCVLELVRGKVSAITFPMDQGGTITMDPMLLRAAVEMIDEIDEGR